MRRSQSLPLLLSAACAAIGAPRVARADTWFKLDLTAGAFHGASSPASANGALFGFDTGGETWFGADPLVGLKYVAGGETGFIAVAGYHGAYAGKPLTISGWAAVGPELLLTGSQKRPGAVLSLAWAPRALLRSSSADAASPAGGELAFGYRWVSFPIWYLHTFAKGPSAAGNFLGASVRLDLIGLEHRS